MIELYIGEGTPNPEVFVSLWEFAKEHPDAEEIYRPRRDGLYILKVTR